MTFLVGPAVTRIKPFLSAIWATFAASSPSGSLVSLSLTNSIAFIQPRPLTSPMQSNEFLVAILLRYWSISSPISSPFCSRFSLSKASMTARAAAQAIGFPPNVPPKPPGGMLSMISALPTIPDMGRPPPILLPTQVRSGSIPKCSIANIFPVLPMPDWISSATNIIPCSSHSILKYSINSFVAIL